MNVRIAVILSITIQTPVGVKGSLFAFGGGIVCVPAAMAFFCFWFFVLLSACVCLPTALGFAWLGCLRGACFCVPAVWAFPWFLIGLLASPLCGAAHLLFFACRKEK
ncbi:hypothetical protein [Paraburkholderia domus]|uniref:hypothetical protein n=1 Tax=Paraburkholderia domus TaxID=2793075 RepID=UPI001B8B4355|nr:hypothetical protein [Paraburkholderia domus]